MKCLDYTEVVDESGLTGIQTNKLFWHFTQVSTAASVSSIIIMMITIAISIFISAILIVIIARLRTQWTPLEA